MPYLQREDCQLYFELHGSGTPFVMLHGNGEDHTYFTHQIEAFSSSYQVITLDTRGHGKSTHGTTTLTFDLFAEDVIALLDELKIEKCILLGFSDGGNTALTLAFRYPDRFLAIIANGADHHPSGVKRSVQWPIVVGYYCCSFFALFSKKTALKREILGLMVHHPNIKKEELATITIPVLILVGDHDMIKESESVWQQRCIPNATLNMIKGTHFIANKEPEAFNQAVSSFFKEYDL